GCSRCSPAGASPSGRWSTTPEPGPGRRRRWAELASGAGAGARPADATSGELGSSVPRAPRVLGAEGILDRRCHATPSRPLASLRIRKSPNARRHSRPSGPDARRPPTPARPTLGDGPGPGGSWPAPALSAVLGQHRVGQAGHDLAVGVAEVVGGADHEGEIGDGVHPEGGAAHAEVPERGGAVVRAGPV